MTRRTGPAATRRTSPGTVAGTIASTSTAIGPARKTYAAAVVDAQLALDLATTPDVAADDDALPVLDDGPTVDDLPEEWNDDEATDDAVDLPDEPDTASRPIPNEVIALWPAAAGQITWSVRMPAGAVLTSTGSAAAVAVFRERLDRVARLLAHRQADAIRAGTLPSAYLQLQVLTGMEVSDVLGRESQTGSGFSRDRGLLVRLPCGLMPLDFFRWRTPANRSAEQIVLALHAHLVAGRSERNTTVPDAIAIEARNAVAKEVAKPPNSVGKHLPAVRAVVENPGIVAAWQLRYPFAGPADLQAALGLVTRAETAMRMALVGVIGPTLLSCIPRRPGVSL